MTAQAPACLPLRAKSEAERPLFSPKQPLRNTHLDSVSMSAFGHKQSFAYRAYACILTVNQCLLSAKSGHSEPGRSISFLPLIEPLLELPSDVESFRGDSPD